jgi:hypothetical protein
MMMYCVVPVTPLLLAPGMGVLSGIIVGGIFSDVLTLVEISNLLMVAVGDVYAAGDVYAEAISSWWSQIGLRGGDDTICVAVVFENTKVDRRTLHAANCHWILQTTQCPGICNMNFCLSLTLRVSFPRLQWILYMRIQLTVCAFCCGS